jgi:D-alanyl-D-alanine dipeptidase
MIFLIFIALQARLAFALPQGFVYLKDIAPEIQQSVRYAMEENFAGSILAGYNAKEIILTKDAGMALKKVNEDVLKEGFEIVIYDGYRPRKASIDMIKWAKSLREEKKRFYFPEISKEDIFKRGFVAEKSSHSRGSTVDVTIIKKGLKVCDVKPIKRGDFIFLDDCTEDMGMHWDFFGTESWTKSPLVSDEMNAKRRFLQNVMEKYGFSGITGEWWHFTLQNEPFKNEYFNFDIQ